MDPRIITTLGVLLGFDITTPSAFTGEDESEEMETDSPPPQTSADSKSASSPNPNSPDSSAPSSSEKVNSKVMSLDKSYTNKREPLVSMYITFILLRNLSVVWDCYSCFLSFMSGS